MSRELSAIVGSGTVPFVRGILEHNVRGATSGGLGVRTGTQVMVGNPEDLLAVDAFASSGVSVPTGTPLMIVGPTNNPLPRCRQIMLENVGSNPVFISHKASFTNEDAWQLSATSVNGAQSVLTLPLLHNNCIYARATGGAGLVRILIF